jgi:hypothetical protein
MARGGKIFRESLNMANGVAIALSSPEPTPEESELAIGEAVADAATAIALAVGAFAQNGELTRATKLAGAEQVAKLAGLQLAYGLDDLAFIDKAREQGKAVLRRRLNGSLAPTQRDAGIDFYLDALFEITGKVVHDERTFRMAMTMAMAN